MTACWAERNSVNNPDRAKTAGAIKILKEYTLFIFWTEFLIKQAQVKRI